MRLWTTHPDTRVQAMGGGHLRDPRCPPIPFNRSFQPPRPMRDFGSLPLGRPQVRTRPPGPRLPPGVVLKSVPPGVVL
jgi:hypothetical protein